MKTFSWINHSSINGLDSLMEVLSQEYPETFPEQGTSKITFENGASGTLRVSETKTGFTIAAGNLAGFARGLGSVMGGCTVREDTPFTTMGIMLDCSRNKVPTVKFFRQYLIRIALMGYNMAMLYTEDTYRMPDEPMFGCMRGGFTMDELREMDRFAQKLGIELIGCIQTLGHLGQILRWNAYDSVRDTGNVMLVDAPETYRLIEKMVRFWQSALSSRRIHIGMDETHDLGRGRFMDLNGYENAYQIFNRHLNKVNEICQRNGLKPIIWSDMFFRLGNKKLDYYDKNTKIPADVRKNIPKNLQLCYWDYYHRDADFYADYIQKHRELGSEPILGSGVWTWSLSWYDHEMTAATVIPCMEACRKTKLKEIFFTMWGDNGGYCLYESALAGLEFAAGLAYGNAPNDDALYRKRMNAVCDMDYRLVLDISDIYHRFEKDVKVHPETLLWDDALLGMAYNGFDQPGILGEYKKILTASIRKISDAATRNRSENKTILALLEAVVLKLDFRKKLLAAYKKKDRAALFETASAAIPAADAALNRFDSLFRENWLANAKPFGLEVIQRRNAGSSARLKEAQKRIFEYLEGSVDTIPELDESLAMHGLGGDAIFNKFYSGSCNL